MHLNIDKKRIADLLCCALEGGSNYWYRIERFVHPKGPAQTFVDLGEVFPHIDYPLNDSGGFVISDYGMGGATTVLFVDWARVQRGLDVMAEKYPRHFGDWLAKNDDASTGDVFLQCVVFGEVVYG